MSLFAVFSTGGKQYRAKPGDFVQIEKQIGDVGSSVTFDQVLLTASSGETPNIQLGKPTISGATVTGQIVGQGRGEKVLIIKMKRRKQYRLTKGHRQEQTQVLVTGISAGSQSATLADADKTALLGKFFTRLTPRGGKVRVAKTRVAPTSEKRASAPAANTEEKAAKSSKKAAAPKAAAKKTTKK
jgi:large subunit ribosomal protein L21